MIWKNTEVSIRIWFSSICLLCSAVIFAQDNTIDSLKKKILTQKDDTNKVNTLLILSTMLHSSGKQTQSIDYLKEALSISEKLNFKRGLTAGYRVIISAFATNNDYIQEINYGYKALQFYKDTKDSVLMAFTEQEIGAIYSILGDTTEALKKFASALAINLKIADKSAVSRNYNSIGMIYCKQGRYKEALDKHFAALKVCEDDDFTGYGWEKAFSYQSIGNVYEKQGDEAEANGKVSKSQKLYLKALQQYETCYTIWENLKRSDSVNTFAELDYVLGKINFKLHNFLLANERLQKSLKAHLQTDTDKQFLDEVYLSLSLLDSSNGNYKSAFQNYKQYIFYKKNKDDQDVIRKGEGFKMKSQFEKKETELKLLSSQSKLQTALTKEQQQKKKIAYAFIGLILVVGGYSFYRFRERRRIKSIQDLTNERLRISQELHDEVGATLSGISMYSHLTKEQLKHAQTNDVEKSLNIIQESAGDMVNKLNDIVWLINPGEDTLQKLVQRLEAFASEMVAIKNMELEVSLPQQFSTQILPVKSRRNIYLFCKEAINNAVKYSEANLLQLTIKENNQLLKITISDNGKGYDSESVKKGNGLYNMQKRADELGADFSIQSRPNEGCLVSLEVKIT